MNVFRCPSCGAFNRISDGPHAGQAVCGRCKASLDLRGEPQAVSQEQLSRAIAASPVPVLVDFWAPWCGPCRVAAPIVAELGRAHRGALIVLKLDTQAHPEAGAAHRVQAIPTFALFSGGGERARQAGLMSRPQLEQWVAQVLSPERPSA